MLKCRGSSNSPVLHLQGSCSVVSAVPVENELKEKARDIIECLRKNGYDEIDIYDLELNSPDRKNIKTHYT